jgi:PAS domain S-box-containing protein
MGESGDWGSQQLLHAIVDSSPLPILVFTPDGKITLWNPAAERVFGWRADEVLGRPLPFIPEDKREEHRAMRARDLEGQRYIEREIVRQRKDGGRIELRVSTAPLRDTAGAITAIMSVYVDVTDQKRYERRLRAQYAVARILNEASSLAAAIPKVLESLCETLNWQAGLFWTREEGKDELRCAALWRDPAQRLTPFETLCREQTFVAGVGLPGRIWASGQPVWISDLSRDSNFPRLEAAAQAGLRAGFGFPILVSEGLAGVMEFFSIDHRPPDDDLLRMAASLGYQMADLLKRERVQKSLAAREESYRLLTETASDGVISIDESSTVLFANRAAATIFGYSREELKGSDLTLLMPDYLRHLHRAAVARYVDTGQRHISWQGVELPGLHQDGHEIPLEISFAEYEQDARHIFIGILRDVTERKRMQEHLRQTGKLESLGVLAGGVAHDFNNLLVGILGNASLAFETLSPENPVRGILREVVTASERAALLTRQLLAYAGKGRFVIEPLDLSALVKEISNLVRTSIPRSVTVRLELSETLPRIDGDAGQLQQLIMNLVINGAEAIGEDIAGTVLVTTGTQEVDESYIRTTFTGEGIRPGSYVTLEVHDTGCGMNEATLGRIFDPFFTTKFTGRGLGLAAAIGIVRSHKGALKVYTTPNRGTTFKVLFPASEIAIRPPESSRPTLPSAGGTILVVDDEEVVRRMVKATLERHGFKVLIAQNGQEAVEAFRLFANEIAVVLLDMTMPVMSGQEALRELKAVRADVKVILSSGFNEVEAVQRFRGKVLAGFIQKPYTAAALVQKIQDTLTSQH